MKQHVALGWWSLFKQVEGGRTESICDGGEGGLQKKERKKHLILTFVSSPQATQKGSRRFGARILNHDPPPPLFAWRTFWTSSNFFWAEKGRISSFPLLITECCYKRIRVSCIRANKKDRRRCDTLIPIPCRRLDFRALRLQKNLFEGERRAAGRD